MLFLQPTQLQMWSRKKKPYAIITKKMDIITKLFREKILLDENNLTYRHTHVK
jgi:hypothetical protein